MEVSKWVPLFYCIKMRDIKRPIKRKRYKSYASFEFACLKTDMTYLEILLYSYIRSWNITQEKPVNNYSVNIAKDLHRTAKTIDKTLGNLYQKGWVTSKFTKGKRLLIARDLEFKEDLI